jgi:hypothetical protein
VQTAEDFNCFLGRLVSNLQGDFEMNLPFEHPTVVYQKMHKEQGKESAAKAADEHEKRVQNKMEDVKSKIASGCAQEEILASALVFLRSKVLSWIMWL